MSQKSFLDNKKITKDFPYVGGCHQMENYEIQYPPSKSMKLYIYITYSNKTGTWSSLHVGRISEEDIVVTDVKTVSLLCRCGISSSLDPMVSMLE